MGFWKDTAELRANWNESRRWTPQWSDQQRAIGYAGWKKAVERTLDLVDVEWLGDEPARFSRGGRRAERSAMLDPGPCPGTGRPIEGNR